MSRHPWRVGAGLHTDGGAPIKMGVANRKECYEAFLREFNGDKARAEEQTVRIWDELWGKPADPPPRFKRFVNWLRRENP